MSQAARNSDGLIDPDEQRQLVDATATAILDAILDGFREMFSMYFFNIL